jgi:indoleamine 2,3-dioxygenase
MLVGDRGLGEAYNTALNALKEFRDAHMIIATLYILGPARRAAHIVTTRGGESLKGTGGTDLVRFLKDTRNRTNEAVITMDIQSHKSTI